MRKTPIEPIDDAQRRGDADRERARPVSDALSLTVALIAASRDAIDRSRRRARHAEATLAARRADDLAGGPRRRG